MELFEKKNLAIQGLEPWTFALLARRSNQLSYTALLIFELDFNFFYLTY